MPSLRHLSLRSQLLLVLLAVAVGSTLVVAAASYRSAEAGLRTAIFDQLTAVRARTGRQIARYFDRTRGEVRLLGETPSVATAARQFGEAFAALPATDAPPADRDALREWYRTRFLPRLAREGGGAPLPENFVPENPRALRLQAAYLLPPPDAEGERSGREGGEPPRRDATEADALGDYRAVHDAYDGYFRTVVEDLGFYDLFLIDAETGDVLYSVEKETDFGTNLLRGPYRGTNLAEAFRTAAAGGVRGQTHLVDFARYAPSGMRPAAFLTTPVLDGPRVVGVLAVQLPIDEIDAVMTGERRWAQEGLGTSGQTYLVGPDRLMRSVSRFYLEDPEDYLVKLAAAGVPPRTVDEIRRSGTTILSRKIDTADVRTALAGRTGTRVVQDFRGLPVLSSFARLDLPGVEWAVIAEKDSAEAFAPVAALRRDLGVLTVVVVCGVTLLSLLAASWFARPIRKLTAAAAQIEKGKTKVHVRVRGRDEFARLATAFNAMVEGITAGREELERQNRENERLLLAILPEPVAARMRDGEQQIADSFADVTVLFAGLSGFGALSEHVDSAQSVAMLNELVGAFDEAAEACGVEKVKTIGEGYMAVCGLSVPRLDHAKRACDFALEMRRVVTRFNTARGANLGVTCGLNSGPVTAGVVGSRKFLYDLWGDTVTLAGDLNDDARPGTVRVSPSVYEDVHDLYELRPAGKVPAPGRGQIETWTLEEVEG